MEDSTPKLDEVVHVDVAPTAEADPGARPVVPEPAPRPPLDPELQRALLEDFKRNEAAYRYLGR